jgi:hypothetical protein
MAAGERCLQVGKVGEHAARLIELGFRERLPGLRLQGEHCIPGRRRFKRFNIDEQIARVRDDEIHQPRVVCLAASLADDRERICGAVGGVEQHQILRERHDPHRQGNRLPGQPARQSVTVPALEKRPEVGRHSRTKAETYRDSLRYLAMAGDDGRRGRARARNQPHAAGDQQRQRRAGVGALRGTQDDPTALEQTPAVDGRHVAPKFHLVTEECCDNVSLCVTSNVAQQRRIVGFAQLFARKTERLSQSDAE